MGKVEDSLLFAKLTLMLLRASVPHPDSLPADYGVVLLPSVEVLSKEQALAKLEQIGSGFQLRAEARGRNLVIAARPDTPTDETKTRVVAESFSEGLRRMTKGRGPNAQVRAVGFNESLLVEADVVARWLWVRCCSNCSVGIGQPTADDSGDVAAVVHLGY